MIIKKFIGKTEEEAVNLAKAELGENIVVMNVRNAPKHGLFRFFKKQMIEVTIAKEDETEKYPVRSGAGVSDLTIKETFRQVAQVAAAAEGKVAEPEHREGLANSESASDSKTTVSGEAIEEKLENLQNLLTRQLQKTEDEEPKKTEIVQEKENEEESQEMKKFVQLLRKTMTDNEIDEKYADQIIDEMKKNIKPGIPFDTALASVYQRMILKFGKTVPVAPAQGKNPKVLFFIGPTGVGKTTTIAKLASQFCLTDEKKVALLTTDTYRIAAPEQLRTYASILKVPFQVIYTVEDIEQAYETYREYDYILVDTAGHSHHNEGQKENVETFLLSADGKVEKEVYLVLSATTKYRDLISIADTYSKMTRYQLIFTKLDETTSLGNLLNLKLYTDAGISYVTYGQNVPDDIECFNPQKSVKLLLGGKN